MPHELTQADRSKGGTVSTAIRRAKRAKVSKTAADAYDLVDSVGREGVTIQSVAATLALSDLLISHNVPAPESAAELEAVAKALKIAHTIMRLEHGETTSNAASITVDGESLAELLRSRATQLADGDQPPLPA